MFDVEKRKTLGILEGDEEKEERKIRFSDDPLFIDLVDEKRCFAEASRSLNDLIAKKRTFLTQYLS